MIKKTFSDGRFVLHKILTGGSKRPISAWYEKNGRLVDASYMEHRADGVMKAISIPAQHRGVLNRLKTIGLRMKDQPDRS